MGKLLRFLENFCAALTKKYFALKKEQSLNLATLVLFSFLQLCNIRGKYSKYFQNNSYETDISSAAKHSTKSCFFARILYKFNVCNKFCI